MAAAARLAHSMYPSTAEGESRFMLHRLASQRSLTLGASCLLHLGLVITVLVAERWVLSAFAHRPPVLPVEIVRLAEPDPPAPTPLPKPPPRPEPPPRALRPPRPIEKPLPLAAPPAPPPMAAEPPAAPRSMPAALEPPSTPEPPSRVSEPPVAPRLPEWVAASEPPPRPAKLEPIQSPEPREPLGSPAAPAAAPVAPPVRMRAADRRPAQDQEVVALSAPAPPTAAQPSPEGAAPATPRTPSREPLPPPSAPPSRPGGAGAGLASAREPTSSGAITHQARPRGGYQVRPSYPSTARRLGVQGTTLLKVHVLIDGRVGEVLVQESAGHADLDQAAAEAVRRWRFEPARRGDDPVAMWVLLPVDFRLR